MFLMLVNRDLLTRPMYHIKEMDAKKNTWQFYIDTLACDIISRGFLFAIFGG